MYIAYVKDIEVGTSLQYKNISISFNDSKSSLYANTIVTLVDAGEDGWYRINGTERTLLHANWIDGLQHVDSNITVKKVRTLSGKEFHFISKLNFILSTCSTTYLQDTYGIHIDNIEDLASNWKYRKITSCIPRGLYFQNNYGELFYDIIDVLSGKTLTNLLLNNISYLGSNYVSFGNIGIEGLLSKPLSSSTKCEMCSKKIPYNKTLNIFYGTNGVIFCEDCYNKAVEEDRLCVFCGKIQNGIKRKFFNGSVCESCVSEFALRKCSKCGTYSSPHSYIQYNGKIICQECNDGKLQRCVRCENAFENTGEKCGIFPDNNRQMLCQLCYQLELDRPFKNYTYKPKPEFLYTSKYHDNTMYYGVEIEVECKKNHGYNAEQIARYIQSKYNWIYCKTDSSLKYGIEFVTHPFNFNWLNSHRNKVLRLLEDIKNTGCSAYNQPTCGMHIHMSRDQFTGLDLYKFLLFIHGETETVVNISQRESGALIRQAKLYDSSEYDRTLSQFCETLSNGSLIIDRHSAVNLRNKNTVEVRIFRGSLNINILSKNIEFLDSLFYFTKNRPIPEINTEYFIKQLEEDKHKYKYLYQFITNKGSKSLRGDG